MPSPKTLSGTVPTRVPIEWDGIQVNTCRNPACQNFGRRPFQKISRKKGAARDGYRIIGGWKARSSRFLYCTFCGESLQLKSNRAISEEIDRLWRLHLPPSGPSCPNTECRNHSRSLDDEPGQYQRFGTTDVGSARYRCKACRKTFSNNPNPTRRQRQPEKNEIVFRCLVNKVPMRRICELAGVAPAVLYNRIHFIHRRCEHFSRAHERPLIDGKAFEQLHIAVDRQDHVLNWGSQMDRRNTQMSAVASAENRTGYVFGMHLDYDPGIDVYEADLHAREIGDYELEGAYRHYARIWLPRDWYREGESRTDFTQPEDDGRLPAQGVRVYRDYTLFAHFLYLRRLLPSAEKILFFLDQESGIRAACLTAFGDRIHQGGMEAFLVKINKSLTIDKKRLAVAAREQGLERARTVAKNADLSNWQVAHTLMEASYRQQLKTVKKAQARWIAHPLPHMGEPEKAVCYLTERSEVAASDVAQMMVHASLHSIDRYFMQLRRRVSLLERPISTPSAVNRVWHGTSAYNPEIAAKLMDIFRVTYNYALAGRDKKTPAMRLGLAKAPCSLDALLNFNPL